MEITCVASMGTLLALVAVSVVQALPYNSRVNLPPPPILLKTIQVASDPRLYTNVTVTFTSSDPIQALWTVNGGFTPSILDKKAEMSVVKEHDTSLTTVSLPISLNLDSLRIHLINSQRSFEAFLEIHVTHAMNDTYEDINQYLLVVPRETEVGLSPLGTRFHAFVNTSGTSFTFGMLQTEMTLLSGNKQNQNVENDVVFSFLPDNKFNKLRISKIAEMNDEYHAHVIFNSPKLYKTGGIVSVLAACTSVSNLIGRLDIKQTLNLHSMPGTLPFPQDSMAFVDVSVPQNMEVMADDKIMIRCKAVGNPLPKLSLYKKYSLPEEAGSILGYETSILFEVSAVFQFPKFSKRMEGNYTCKASNGHRQIHNSNVHSVTVVSTSEITSRH